MSTKRGEKSEERTAVPTQLRLGLATPAFAVGVDGQPDHLAAAIEAPRLEWRAEPGGTLWSSGVLASDCLWSFIHLAEATDEQVLEFARQYGVLGICRHGLPVTHDDCPARRLSYGPGDEWYWEDLSHWRKLAGQLDALLGIYHDLRGELPVAPELWARLYTILDKPLPLFSGDQWSRVADYVSYLVRLANLTLRPRLFDGFELVAAPADWPARLLFRTLVLQLANALCGEREVIHCDSCGHPYGADRKAREDRHNYCSACWPAAILRIKRESWQRHKDRHKHLRAGRDSSGDS